MRSLRRQGFLADCTCSERRQFRSSGPGPKAGLWICCDWRIAESVFRRADRSRGDLVGTLELEPLAGIIGRRELPPSLPGGMHLMGIRFREQAEPEPEGILQPTEAVGLGRRAPSFRRVIRPDGSSFAFGDRADGTGAGLLGASQARPLRR